MAHKTLIGGTAYEITGGKTLVDGTAYSIKSGKTLVGGTAYDVGFAPPVPIITFTTPNTFAFYVTHNGTKYTDNTTFEAAVGDTIVCNTSGSQAYIYYNGTLVKSSSVAGQTLSYNHTVVGNTTIRCEFNMGKSYMYITD